MLIIFRIILLIPLSLPTLPAIRDIGFSAESIISGIDRISIVENKLIMIHTNSVQAYLLPAICFGSDIKYNLFKDFIKTKCAAVDTYK